MPRYSNLERAFLFKRQDGTCFHCEVEMTLDIGLLKSCTRDHIVPRGLGGSNTVSNYVGACLACNVLRGIRDFLEYQAFAKSVGHVGVIATLGASVKWIGFGERCVQMEWRFRDEVRRRFPPKPRLPAKKLTHAAFDASRSAKFSLADVWPQQSGA